MAIKSVERLMASLTYSVPTHIADHQRGVEYATDEQYPKAVESFRKAISLCPSYGEAWFHLALALEAIGFQQRLGKEWYSEAYLACVSACRFVPHFIPAKEKAAFLGLAVGRTTEVDLWPRPPNWIWRRFLSCARKINKKSDQEKNSHEIINKVYNETKIRTLLRHRATDEELLVSLALLLSNDGRSTEAQYIVRYANAFHPNGKLVELAGRAVGLTITELRAN